jgi:hypothetical protein
MSYAADRLIEQSFGAGLTDEPWTEPEPGEVLPANIARCPVCQAKVRTALPNRDRVAEHALTPACEVRRVQRRMHERGWVRAGQWGPVLQRCNLPVERHPIGTTQVAYEDAPEPWRSRARANKKGGYNLVDVPIEGPWGERLHVACARDVSGVEIPATTRHALILRMVRDPEFREVLGAAKALGGAASLLAYGRRHGELAMEALGPPPLPLTQEERHEMALAELDVSSGSVELADGSHLVLAMDHDPMCPLGQPVPSGRCTCPGPHAGRVTRER